MKKIVLFLLFFILLISAPQINAQELVKNSVVTGICYAGKKVNRIFIPPPEEFLKKGGLEKGALIQVYYSGFTDAAVNAIEYAVSILGTMLPDDVKITILANWTNISDGDVLANSSTTGYAAGWGIDAQVPFAFYPAALAEKIIGKSLNFDLEGDIELNINSSVNWYLGTDGKTPVSRYDLATVVLHELIHGLGFFDSMNADETSGSYGVGSIPLIYDTFVENAQGKKLTDTLLFNNPSAALKAELTGGQLYFNGPLLKKYTSGERAKLYVPSTFDRGSSVAHLDEDATLEVNQLMTPYIDRGEAIHNPGKYILSILGDLGWINTRIIHEAPRDTEEVLSEITLSTTIISDTTYNRNKVGIAYSFDESGTSDTVMMTSQNGDDNFSATIQIPSYETRLTYYLFTEDAFLRMYRSPSFIDVFRYAVYIGTDTVKPVITHTPAEYYFEVVDTIRFNVEATDNLGIDTVYIEYKVNNGVSRYFGLNPGSDDKFSNALNIKTLSITSTDSLRYRIIALDKAAVSNLKTLPSDGFFSIHFEHINPVADTYSTNFTGSAGDFFNDGFEILKPNGFSNYGLHTEHPYRSPEESGDSIGYTALLRTPLKFDASGMIISFLEEALVEPGEDGSVFGTPEFYDYVVVEGSKNFGKSWFYLTKGYDCRYKDSWETAYNSAITDMNSTYQGNESLLDRHSIFLKASSDISTGDTMMIRFRLYSDPYANGWGWCIEDLHIGPLINNVEDISYTKPVIYPNPGNGLITIRQTEGAYMKPTRFSIFNSTGTCLVNSITDGAEEIKIDISGYPSGLYFIILYNDYGIRSLKYSLIK